MWARPAFLTGGACSMMSPSHATRGEELSEKKSPGAVNGIMSQSGKMKVCQTAQKEGEKGLKMLN